MVKTRKRRKRNTRRSLQTQMKILTERRSPTEEERVHRLVLKTQIMNKEDVSNSGTRNQGILQKEKVSEDGTGHQTHLRTNIGEVPHLTVHRRGAARTKGQGEKIPDNQYPGIVVQTLESNREEDPLLRKRMTETDYEVLMKETGERLIIVVKGGQGHRLIGVEKEIRAGEEGQGHHHLHQKEMEGHLKVNREMLQCPQNRDRD